MFTPSTVRCYSVWPISVAWRAATPLLALMGMAALYSVLPWAVHGYTFPPGDDVQWHWRTLQEFPVLVRYYGHLPGGVIGLTAYYYLTPALTAIGLWVALHRYSSWTPALAWLALWVIGRSPLLDMAAGTFVAVLGTYALAPVVWRGLSRGRQRWYSALYLPALVVFHTYSGMLVLWGAGAYALFARRRDLFRPVALGLCVAALAGAFMGASSALVLNLGEARLTVPMNVAGYIKAYLGVPGVAFLTFAGLVAQAAWRRGYRPRTDPFCLMLLALIPPLVLLTFTPLQINSDRTAKVLAAVLVLYASISITDALALLRSRALIALVVAFVAALAALAALDSIPFWLESGTWRTP